MNDEHAEERTPSFKDGLPDQHPSIRGRHREVSQDERDGTQEQVLERRVAEHDRRVVLRGRVATSTSAKPPKAPTKVSGMASATFDATRK